ncbi:MAG: IS200/IS605 family transposase [Pyrinomonadaceae bacterium]|nr:IS200/IS605 family transposase [Pyrinomonadaceae bacterium]
MPHTYSNLLTHIVFSTKERRHLLTKEINSELYAYLGGLVKELNGKPVSINGVSDHVHMLIILPPTVNISDAMRFVKTNSSKWVSKRFGVPFAWQTGYGAFSVSRSQADTVAVYIERQEQQHQRFDFRNEFLLLLRKYEVEFDERFLWT